MELHVLKRIHGSKPITAMSLQPQMARIYLIFMLLFDIIKDS